MSPTPYRNQELERILSEFKSNATLSDLGSKVGRTPYSIALKMRKLAKQYPEKWKPTEVAQYTSTEMKKHKGDIRAQKRRYRARKRGEDPEYKRELYVQPPKINWQKFRDYLEDFMRDYLYTKKEFADEMGIHPSLLSHYLSGRRKPNNQFFIYLSEEYPDEFKLNFSQ